MGILRGLIGEWIVRISLRFLPKSTYRVFNDLTFEVMDGTTQIDHVVVSRYGVFVVETKTMSGRIYGRSTDKQWTQTFSKTAKFQFQNPLRQNYRHIKCLAELTDFPVEFHQSLVCFLGPASFQYELPREVLVGVPLWRILSERSEIRLSEDEVRAYCAILRMTAMPKGKATQKRHLESLKARRS